MQAGFKWKAVVSKRACWATALLRALRASSVEVMLRESMHVMAACGLLAARGLLGSACLACDDVSSAVGTVSWSSLPVSARRSLQTFEMGQGTDSSANT